MWRDGVAWPDQTLTQQRGTTGASKSSYPSYVVTNSHRLRYKPLREFSAEDLRFMLTQQNSLPILIPMALDVLEADPFAGGDVYEGALLHMAVRIDPQFWRDHPRLCYRMDRVLLRRPPDARGVARSGRCSPAAVAVRGRSTRGVARQTGPRRRSRTGQQVRFRDFIAALGGPGC